MKLSDIIVILGDDNYLLQLLKTNLELIKTVNEHFKHIDELDKLTTLFLWFVDEDNEKRSNIMRFCHLVSEATRRNHYNGNAKVEDVYTILAELSRPKFSMVDESYC